MQRFGRLRVGRRNTAIKVGEKRGIVSRLISRVKQGQKLKAAAEGEYQKRMREIMTDNARKLCMGEMKVICEPGGIKLHTSVR